MKEEEIRPQTLMYEDEILHRIDVSEMLKWKNAFVKISCPACESLDHKLMFEKEGFSFVRCVMCNTLFINPRPTFKMLSDFYSNSKSIKHWNDKIFPSSEEVRRAKIFLPRAEKVKEIYLKYKGRSGGTLLDVGAGFGTFCEEVKKTGAFDKVIAVEPSPSLAETCRRKGLNVIEKPIEEVEMSDVDLITNFELIEHLYWPKDFVISCAKMLPKNGLFVLTTPNIEGFDLVMLGPLSDNIVGPNHLNYFNPYSLTQLLQRCGFEVLEITTPGKLDAEIVRKKVLDGKYDISSCPFLKEILIDRWESVGINFQKFLVENKLSSHMWVVARKI
ncbi:MAG: class I SAM-dependent methyltransferase [Candidatus Micrarchaeia archaeon]